MATATLTRSRTRWAEEPPNLPTVEYPPEVLERLRIKSEIARHQLAIGEIRPMSARELAAMYGMTIDG